ncbi:hypothetical protein Moror_12316 [Moniliophthora roreri MCA 2997]|uniref:Uncharacterized protein n=2 Tax=Moniliophthora roreri TaxID=221103 RepID=V2X9P9_MONRO|nr:hypothetical protein Moror_12316 [Moniliophthora roreri MCA 2997]KAI3615847.1 hypothetical protein WG66_010234 [Moniliophthora roreri]
MSVEQEQEEREHSLGTTTPPWDLVPRSVSPNHIGRGGVESDNVIAQSQQVPAEAEPHIPGEPLSLSLMPTPSDIALHSPSANIIGTPFATNTPRFEYPFPDSAFSNESIPSSTSVTSSTSSSSLSLLQSPPLIPSLPSREGPTRSQSPTHPKMMKNVVPPVPPSLITKAAAKKSQSRWSMGLLGRRAGRNQSHSQSDTEGGSGSGGETDLKRRFSAGSRTPPEVYWTPMMEAPMGSVLSDEESSTKA